MVISKFLRVVVLSSILLSVRSSIERSTEPCPTNAIVDLTATIPNSSWSVEKGGTNFPQKSVERLECPCSSKICISLCCPSGMARLEGSCVEDNETSSILPKIIDDDYTEMNVSEQDYHLFTYDPCAIGWMAPSIIERFDIFENGSVYSPDFGGGSLSNFEEYCLMRKPKSNEYVAKVCRPWIHRSYYYIACYFIAIPIMLVILIAYSIVPELKNLHGLVFRSYVITYIGVYTGCVVVVYTTESRTHPNWFTFSEITTRYLCACCTLWLNVMSFNIWRSFRGLRPTFSIYKRREKRIFIWYAIYAWISPSIMLGLTIALTIHVPYFHTDTYPESLKKWSTGVVFVCGQFFNIFLHTCTALNIKQHRKETKHLTEGVNKHYEVERQWFNLYLKLFIIMGGHTVMWPIWLVWPYPIIMHFLTTLEVTHGVLILLIFIWKDSIRRSLWERFDKGLQSLLPALVSSESSATIIQR